MPLAQRAFGALLDASLHEYHHLRETEEEGGSLPSRAEDASPEDRGPELTLVHALLRYIRGLSGAAEGFAAAARAADRRDVRAVAAVLAGVVHREYGALDHAEGVLDLGRPLQGGSRSQPEVPDEPAWLEPAVDALLELQRSAIMAEGGNWGVAAESSRAALDGVANQSDPVSQVLRTVAASNLHVFTRLASSSALRSEVATPAVPAGPDADLFRGLAISHGESFAAELTYERRSTDYGSQHALWRGLIRRECLGDHRESRQLREALGRQQLADALADRSDPGRDPFLLLVRGSGTQRDVAGAATRFLRGGPTDGLRRAVATAAGDGWRAQDHRRAVLELLAGAGDVLDEPTADRLVGQLLDPAGGASRSGAGWYDARYYSLRALTRVLVAASPDTHRRTAAWVLRRADGTDEALDDLAASQLVPMLQVIDWSSLDAREVRAWEDFVERGLATTKPDVAARALYGLASRRRDWARTTAIEAYRAAPDLLRGALALDLDDDLPPDVQERIREEASRATASRRESAAQARHTFGAGPNELVVLVAALLRQGDAAGWRLVTDSVLDEHVLVTHKAPVIGWLVRHGGELPAEVVAALREGLSGGLPGLSDVFLGKGEAEREGLWLRLAFTHDFGEAADRMQRLARLAGDVDPSARREAAESLTAAVAVSAEAGPLALVLAHDAVAEVRGAAAAPLLKVARSDHPASRMLSSASEERARGLLAELGLSAPYAVIRALAAEPVGSPLRQSLAGDVARAAEEHVSAYVRRAARELASQDG